MALYLIGDIQGCDVALQRLLDAVSFSPSRDTLLVLGDLVNRGPDSLAVLRRLMGYEGAARCLLGNHDLHLLTLAYGLRKPSRSDTLDGVLQASGKRKLIDWLRTRPLAMLETIENKPLLMVHAGVLPAWTAQQTIQLAHEVEAALQSAEIKDFLQHLYGNSPARWDAGLVGYDRLRVVVNALTRLRFCTADGAMEFDSKEGAGAAPAGCMPWFEVPGRQTANVTVAFGHWSTLGHIQRAGVLAMDTGCVWGGCLSALRIGVAKTGNHAAEDSSAWDTELIQVHCPQAQKPG